VNSEIAFDDLILKLLDLDLVHLLDLSVAFQICLFEMLELTLQLLELPGDSLVFLAVDLVHPFKLLIEFDVVTS
jgi:hypothetical protein